MDPCHVYVHTHTHTHIGIYVDPWATPGEEALGQDAGRDGGGGGGEGGGEGGRAAHKRHRADKDKTATIQDKHRKASLPGSPAFEVASTKNKI